jgi:hypothetical protein
VCRRGSSHILTNGFTGGAEGEDRFASFIITFKKGGFYPINQSIRKDKCTLAMLARALAGRNYTLADRLACSEQDKLLLQHSMLLHLSLEETELAIDVEEAEQKCCFRSVLPPSGPFADAIRSRDWTRASALAANPAQRRDTVHSIIRVHDLQRLIEQRRFGEALALTVTEREVDEVRAAAARQATSSKGVSEYARSLLGGPESAERHPRMPTLHNAEVSFALEAQEAVAFAMAQLDEARRAEALTQPELAAQDAAVHGAGQHGVAQADVEVQTKGVVQAVAQAVARAVADAQEVARVAQAAAVAEAVEEAREEARETARAESESVMAQAAVKARPLESNRRPTVGPQSTTFRLPGATGSRALTS